MLNRREMRMIQVMASCKNASQQRPLSAGKTTQPVSPKGQIMQRFKPYQVPHKGFRTAIAKLVMQAGSADYTDDTDLAALRVATESVFASLDHHAHVEEEFILNELAKVNPSASQCDADMHRRLEEVESKAMALLDQIVRENAARNAAGFSAIYASDETASQFYLTLTDYQAMQLGHMFHEETVTQPLLIAHFSEEQILEIDERIVRHLNETIPPEQMLTVMSSLITYSTPNERIQMLGRMKAGMPNEVFAQIFYPVTAALSERDRQKLQLALA
jgi:Hemerythrin HHE cation binding domain